MRCSPDCSLELDHPDFVPIADGPQTVGRLLDAILARQDSNSAALRVFILRSRQPFSGSPAGLQSSATVAAITACSEAYAASTEQLVAEVGTDADPGLMEVEPCETTICQSADVKTHPSDAEMSELNSPKSLTSALLGQDQ
ncbi:unnamed protein product [Protopolystoma xenopodis]|uniref:Uncharacterized protein n=1 Tax=Protopolystoma xenopodis TaxID=117903 RepID=A0A3S5ARE7_9PLAT|nr:unnamed protein product [Protopolystoma xenopodis]